MIAAVAVGILIIAAVAYVVRPIGRGRRDLVEEEGTSEADEKKRVALSGILDLEEERDGGKLSEEEFRALRVRYEHDAVAALKELDAQDGASNVEDRLEREIALAREKLRCRTCGTPRDEDAKRCPSCGSSY